eukprot:12182776-Alexandrium_andersonii.AAC.1
MPSSPTALPTPARMTSQRAPEPSGRAEASSCGATCKPSARAWVRSSRSAQLRSSWPPTGLARSVPCSPRCSG